LREDGLLIDGRTGEVINEYGATRFDVATRALRGEFDPPEGVPNTERNDGLLLDSLIKWPATYEFQFVLRSEGALADIVLEEYRALVSRYVHAFKVVITATACLLQNRKHDLYCFFVFFFCFWTCRTCEVQVDPKICTIKTRMGGKYVSLTIPAIVRAPGIIQKVFAAVENDKRIVMKF